MSPAKTKGVGPPPPGDILIRGEITHTVWVRPKDGPRSPAAHWTDTQAECERVCRRYLLAGMYAWVKPSSEEVPQSLEEAKRFCEDPDALEELRPRVEHETELAYERHAREIHERG